MDGRPHRSCSGTDASFRRPGTLGSAPGIPRESEWANPLGLAHSCFT